MIPNTTSHVAFFKHEHDGESHTVSEDIIAWADDGTPLIVGPRGLVAASSRRNFDGISERDELDVVGVVPGQGWNIQQTNADGRKWLVPVIAFAIDAKGYGSIITASSHGEVEREHVMPDRGMELVPPGGWVEMAPVPE